MKNHGIQSSFLEILDRYFTTLEYRIASSLHVVWTVIYGIFVITLIACGKLPVMSRLDRYLEATRI